jgi:DNA-binding transcriptional MerR regulator
MKREYMNLISIGKASKILGVTPKTLRIWEKCGKLIPKYTPNGHRRYDYNQIISYYTAKNE